MTVSTRLWIAGVVQHSRDRSLADQLLRQVRRCAMCLRAMLVLTDGWNAYPGSIRRAFRQKGKRTARVGRTCLQRRKRTEPLETASKGPFVRLRKEILCSSTV